MENAVIPVKSNPLSFDHGVESKSHSGGIDIGFIISDDQPLDLDGHDGITKRSVGQTWLQGHMAIGICHFLLDEGITLNL